MVMIRAGRRGDAAALSTLARAAYAPYLERMDGEPAPMQADYAALIASG